MSDQSELAETAQNTVLEAVQSEGVTEEPTNWRRQVAFTTMVMALLAALGGLLAGITANEALLDRTKEIMEVSYLEGDRAYVETVKAKHEILLALGEKVDPVELADVQAFEQEMREMAEFKSRDAVLAAAATKAHQVFAIAVTLLSLGITLAGMSLVVERKSLWGIGLVMGALGGIGLALGIVKMFR